MKRVYVAGAYSGPTVIEILNHVHRGLVCSRMVEDAGFAVYSPWTDIALHVANGCPPIEQCYGRSMAWLEVSNAVIVVPEDAGTSIGTQAEVKRAKQLHIPVFQQPDFTDALELLKRHFAEERAA